MTETSVATGPLLRHDGGLLGRALERQLATVPQPPTSVQLIAADTPDAGAELTGTETTGPQRTEATRAWLPVVAELDRIVIGPLVRPGLPGCDHCLSERRAGARVDAAEEAALQATYGNRLTGEPSPLLTPLAADLAATVALSDAAAVPTDTVADAPGVVTMIRLADLQITRHSFLPDPHCPRCGGLPDDSPAAAAAAFARVPRPKPDPAVLRVRELRSEETGLEALYADDETGVIKDLQARGLHALPFAEAKVGPRASVDGGYGRALDFRTARVTAIAEALERLGGGRPGGRRTAVEACYRTLAARDPDGVLDPTRVGSHEPHRYQQPEFPYQAYHPDLVMPWVWGYSLTRERPVLVPESLAYYRIGRHSPQARPFVSEISNGCALGGCPEEAALYGLLELAERDAFLLTWYARMPAPAVDLRTARDRRLGLLADHILERTGYRVEVLDVTGAEGIPSFWAAAIDTAPDRAAPARACCAPAAPASPRSAASSARSTSWSRRSRRTGWYPDRHADAARMREDPELVRQMDDHALLYCDPLAARRLDFLLSPERADRVDLRDLEARYAWPRHTDLRADLDELVNRFAAGGLEAIIVDQTTPVHTASGLSCVKAVVPGLLPMTFGHHLRRIAGLDRVLSAPQTRGRTTRPLTPDQVNPHPHPFP